MEAHLELQDAKRAELVQEQKVKTKKARQAAMAKATAAKKLKVQQRELVRKKVEQGLPITEQEREMLGWKAGGQTRSKEERQRELIAQAAKLMIKPSSVTELRMLVETTAAKNNYNPIESLIHLTNDPTVKETDKIAIHKALLPFLVPQLATPKATNEKAEGGVKVTVAQFVFNGPREKTALHAEKPAMTAEMVQPQPTT